MNTKPNKVAYAIDRSDAHYVRVIEIDAALGADWYYETFATYTEAKQSILAEIQDQIRENQRWAACLRSEKKSDVAKAWQC